MTSFYFSIFSIISSQSINFPKFLLKSQTISTSQAPRQIVSKQALSQVSRFGVVGSKPTTETTYMVGSNCVKSFSSESTTSLWKDLQWKQNPKRTNMPSASAALSKIQVFWFSSSRLPMVNLARVRENESLYPYSPDPLQFRQRGNTISAEMIRQVKKSLLMNSEQRQTPSSYSLSWEISSNILNCSQYSSPSWPIHFFEQLILFQCSIAFSQFASQQPGGILRCFLNFVGDPSVRSGERPDIWDYSFYSVFNFGSSLGLLLRYIWACDYSFFRPMYVPLMILLDSSVIINKNIASNKITPVIQLQHIPCPILQQSLIHPSVILQFVNIIQMYHTIQQQVDELFDRADHPNIAHRDDGDFLTLRKVIKSDTVSCQDSIKIIKDVLEAYIYVSSHLLIYKPCQIFKQHIIRKNDRWGLCNIICYRDPNENPEFSPDRYYPLDYYEHDDEDSELAWSIGRMWYELLTDSRIPAIRTLNDKQLTQIIEFSNIKDIRIVNFLKEILVVDKQRRMSMDRLVRHALFQYEQTSKIFLHSVIPNLSQIQQTSKLISHNQFESKINKQFVNPYNPYEQQLFKRDFREALAIAGLFQKVKQFIFNSFEVTDDNNEINFCCYLIDLASYLRLRSFQIKREENSYLIVLLFDKIDYTKFLEKLLEFEGKIEKKKKLKKYESFRIKYPQLFQSPSQISQENEKNIHLHFKKYLMSFAKEFKQHRKLNSQTNDYKNYVSLIEIMLVRTSKYVFGNSRKYVFGDFINEDYFDLQHILRNIQRCTDVTKLRRIEEKILELYFEKREE